MPYIPQEQRDFVKRNDWTPATTGQLAFIAYQKGMDLLNLSPVQNWDRRMDIYKAIKGAADEWRRRMVDPYEDEAIKRNGDIF